MGESVPMSAGLPQGGVLSPTLWILFFNSIHQELRNLRIKAGFDPERFLDIIYADNVTIVIEADTFQQASHTGLAPTAPKIANAQEAEHLVAPMHTPKRCS